MSALPQTATREEVEDEIQFVQIQLSTVDPDAEEAADLQKDLEIALEDLARRMEAFEHGASGNRTTPERVESADLPEMLDLPSRERRPQNMTVDNTQRSASPLDRPLSSIKRPREDSWSFAGLDAGEASRKVRRTSDDSDITTPTQNTDDLEMADRNFDRTRGVKISDTREAIMKKIREKHKMHEERLRREQEDLKLARQLAQGNEGQGTPSSFAYPNPFSRSDPPRTQSYLGVDGRVKRPLSPYPPPPTTPSFSTGSYPAFQSYASKPWELNMWKQESGKAGAPQARTTRESSNSDDSLTEITPMQFAASASSPRSAARVKHETRGFDSVSQALRARLSAPSPYPSAPGPNPMTGGTSVYRTGQGSYSVNNIPTYGNGFRPNVPGAYPRDPHDIENLVNLVGLTPPPAPGRTLAYPFPLDEEDEYDPYGRIRYGGGYGGGGYVPGGMSEDDVEEMMKAVQADKHFPLEKRANTPRAFAQPLYEHQRIGLTWLMLQEENKSCKGGILADDMGLGKTIQALALIVAKPSEDRSRKTTLIIAPVALMRQWEKEINDKLMKGHKLKVYVLHGQKKTSFAKLSTYDVVLTTFGRLGSEYTRRQKMVERLAANPEGPRRETEQFNLIGRECKWYRVIVDEAQCIKNKSTKAALGAFALDSTYRLCMTGTPMMNNISELHSLIWFLRIQPYNDAEKFNRDIKRPLNAHHDFAKQRAMQAVQATLKIIMLRRTKKSEIDGKPIIENLPERSTEIVRTEFDEHQEAFYRAIETEAQIQVNAYLEAGKIGKNYSYILVRLLRLRQACCHPHLIRDFAENGAAAEVSGEDMEELARSFEDNVVVRLKEANGSFECPICYDATESPTLIYSCGHYVCGDCFTRLVDPSIGIANGNEGGAAHAKCPECRGALDPRRVLTWRAFQKVHLPESLPEEERAQAVVEEEDSDSDSDEDSDDDDDADGNGDLRDFIVNDDEVKEEDEEEALVDDDEEVKPEVKDDDETASELDADDEEPVRKAPTAKASEPAGRTTRAGSAQNSSKGKSKAQPKGKGKGRRKGKGKKKAKKKKTLADLKRESQRNAAAKKKYLKRLRKTWVPSAKTNRTIELLRTIRERGEGEKTIIFSQFTTLLDLLEVAIGDEFKYRRYDGGMRTADRNKSVEAFQNQENGIEVLLVSLKAGNAGLNLTAANQVIILDPFWNPFIEEQAIDRAHRIGQMRPVQVHRVLVENTVEDRIIALQEKKRELINTALDEKAGEGLGRLGIQELRYLFGFHDRLPSGNVAPAAGNAGITAGNAGAA